jgi:hypothetical protein
MLVINLRKTTSSGNSGNMSHCSCGGKKIAKPYKRMYSNGCCQEVYDMAATPGIKQTEILRNVKLKKTMIPKKYITFE